jgi:hypothetical protein
MKRFVLWMSLVMISTVAPLKAEFRQIDLTTFGMD